jgi:hypothetical protein
MFQRERKERKRGKKKIGKKKKKRILTNGFLPGGPPDIRHWLRQFDKVQYTQQLRAVGEIRVMNKKQKRNKQTNQNQRPPLQQQQAFPRPIRTEGTAPHCGTKQKRSSTELQGGVPVSAFFFFYRFAYLHFFFPK